VRELPSKTKYRSIDRILLNERKREEMIGKMRKKAKETTE
jgi:hypothetical protein